MPPSPVIFDALREAYVAGNLIVFVGAGVSAAASLPTWPQLVVDLVARVRAEGKSQETIAELDDLVRRGRLIDALSAVRHTLGEHEFNIAIEKAVDDSGVPVPDVVKAVAELEPKLRAVITTNLDHLLERAFMGSWPALTSPPGDLAQRRGYILKLHGTRLDRSSWVFTRDDYDRATFGHSRHHETFASLFRAFPMLFVGYGLSDDDFDLTLAATRALAGPQPPAHFAVLKGPVAPHRRRTLESSGLRLLEYGDHGEVPGILRAIP